MPLNLKRAGVELKAAIKDRARSNFRETFRAPSGARILCESKGERDFWEGFSKAITTGEIKPEDFSIRNVFESVVDDGAAILEDWRGGGSVTLLEAAGAISSQSFSNITGQIVYSKILDAFQLEGDTIMSLIPTVPTQFNGERIPGIGRIGDQAEIVNEGGAYPLAGVNEDYIDTPATVKRGMIVPVTKEAVFFDRTNLILSRAGEVGTWLGLNKEKRACDCLVDENTTAHRLKWRGTTYATYQTSTPWINSATSNALENWSNIDAVEQLLANMTDPNTGEPIMVMADTLVVNPQLRARADQILNATQLMRATGGYAVTGNLNQTLTGNTVGSSLYSPRYKIVSSRMMPTRTATDTNWFLGNPAKALAYMENWPLKVEQAPPNSAKEFENDIVAQYKASERGAYAVLEPRYMAKSAA